MTDPLRIVAGVGRDHRNGMSVPRDMVVAAAESPRACNDVIVDVARIPDARGSRPETEDST